jgi:AcrR family transcriptional regulator
VTGTPADRTDDPRVTRTAEACEKAVVELASERPVSQVTVAELAQRAGVTRATFYNHYSSPLDVLLRVLFADLEEAHRVEEEQRAEGMYSAAEMLRLTIVGVADHIERFQRVYHHAVTDPADSAVYEALVQHFTDYATAFIARSESAQLPGTNRVIITRFVAHGFAGAIRAWLSDETLTKTDLVDATVSCAPVWWS